MKPLDQKPPGTLENDPGIGRKSTGEMDAEIASMLFKGAMYFVAIFAVYNHPPLAKRG